MGILKEVKAKIVRIALKKINHLKLTKIKTLIQTIK
jgi:hypothetical protein